MYARFDWFPLQYVTRLFTKLPQIPGHEMIAPLQKRDLLLLQPSSNDGCLNIGSFVAGHRAATGNHTIASSEAPQKRCQPLKWQQSAGEPAWWRSSLLSAFIHPHVGKRYSHIYYYSAFRKHFDVCSCHCLCGFALLFSIPFYKPIYVFAQLMCPTEPLAMLPLPLKHLMHCRVLNIRGLCRCIHKF